MKPLKKVARFRALSADAGAGLPLRNFMPGLIASSSSSNTDNSEWAFNLRDSSRFYYDACSNLDSDSDSESVNATATANKPASHAQLLKDLDLSTRGDTAVYTANPWTIAKQNAACRETSAFVSTSTASRIGIDKTGSIARCNPPSAALENAPKKSAQTTLDKAFTVEKKNKFLKPVIVSSGNVKLSSPASAPGEFQTGAFSNSAVPTIPNKRCFSGQDPNAYGHYSSTIVYGCHYPNNTLPKVSNPYEAPSLVSSLEPKKGLLSDTTNPCSSRTFPGERTKPTTKPFINPTPNINTNLKRKRAYITFSSDSDSDSNWTTLPSKLKKRFIKPESLLPPFSRTTTGEQPPKPNPAVKSSGRFKLPIPIPIRGLSSSSSSSSSSSKMGTTGEVADSESATVVAASTSTEKLSSGRRLTLYKPPAMDDVTRMPGEKPVILSVRRAGRLNSNLGKAQVGVGVSLVSVSAGRLKEVKEDSSVVISSETRSKNEVNTRVYESSIFTPCSSPPFFSSSSSMIDSSILSYSIPELEMG